MSIENVEVRSLLAWLHDVWWHYGGTLLVVFIAGLVVAWLIAALRSGPERATLGVWKRLCEGLIDLTCVAPRRVLALAWLAVKESIRRRVVVAIVVFLLLLLFAGWFLDPASNNPVRLYMNTVLFGTWFLVLVLMVILSTFSLPKDIKDRTIFTIVTKPVRTSEIVIGRIVGFSVIGSVLLAMMGTASYLFVVRGLNHTHEVVLSDLVPETPSHGGGHKDKDAKKPQYWSGRTGDSQKHHHDVQVDSAGNAHIRTKNGHWHSLDLKGHISPDGVLSGTVTTGPAEGLLVARVPIYGHLRFLDRQGHPANEGINVGDESTYRSFIDGGTMAAAIWTFDNVQEAKYHDGLPIDLTISVFRTHKGDIERGVTGRLFVRNPKTGRSAEVRVFQAKKLAVDSQFIPRKLQAKKPDGSTEEVDLYNDLTADGKVEVWLRCVDSQQLFGVAERDLYIRAPRVAFGWNFAKAYFGIWLQMVLAIAIGVFFSTFLSSPIALLATASALTLGLFSPFLQELASGKAIGGGPVESAQRIWTQENLVTPLEPGLQTTIVKAADQVLSYVIGVVARVLPDLNQFDYTDLIGEGFNIDGEMALIHGLTALGFVVPLLIVAYFFLKTREVGQ